MGDYEEPVHIYPEWLGDMAEAGLTQEEMGEIAGVSQTCNSKHMHRYGVESSHGAVPQEDVVGDARDMADRLVRKPSVADYFDMGDPVVTHCNFRRNYDWIDVRDETAEEAGVS